MVSFDDLVLLDGMPIYQQILRHVKLGIAGGTIAPGDALPSRRVLSALLGVNPNTVLPSDHGAASIIAQHVEAAAGDKPYDRSLSGRKFSQGSNAGIEASH